jgi:hypothetical protein
LTLGMSAYIPGFVTVSFPPNNPNHSRKYDQMGYILT